MNNNLSLTNCLENLRQQYNIVAEIDCSALSATQLAAELKQAHRDAFEGNERIVIYYVSGNQHTQQNIQTILNVVDISNFFVCVVTTEEQKDVISSDSIPFTFIQVDGDYSLINQDERPISKEDITRVSAALPDLLANSKHFCMAPWVHLYVDILGDARLCCWQKEVIGNVSKNSLTDMLHSNSMNETRLALKDDLPIAGCYKCYNEEALGRSSNRNAFNQKYSHHYNRINTDDPTIIHWDFRFSNLCNLSCRSCGPKSSTSWYKPAQAIGIQQTQYVCNDSKVYEQLLEYINDVEEIYFAGGEPLIMPEHYMLLDKLIKTKRTNVRLVYNTNLTEISFKGRSVFDLWNHFDSVAVCASLDASGKRAEYLRCGTTWDRIVENRKQMIEKCPDIYFWVSATTGMINALHVADFHREWVEQDLIKPEHFNIQNIYEPEYMRVDRATVELRDLIIKKYKDHLAWLSPLDTEGRATQGFQSVIKYLDNLKGFDKELFWSNIKPLDEYYGVNLLDVFPELDILPKP